MGHTKVSDPCVGQLAYLGATLLAVASCVLPRFVTEGRPCSPEIACPDGARCDLARGLCVATTMDGAASDRQISEGSVGGDAKLGDSHQPLVDGRHLDGRHLDGTSLDRPSLDGRGRDTRPADGHGTDLRRDSGQTTLCAAQQCEIGGICHNSGEHNPSISCQLCDPTRNLQAWSLAGSGCVVTVAGSGLVGKVDGVALQATLNAPAAIAFSPGGVLYIADTNNHVIRVLRGGVVTTLAGSGKAGYAEGSGLRAQFDTPRGIAVDEAGDLYVADTFNHRIRKISGSAVTTIAGGGPSGAAGGDFVDGTTTMARFNHPYSVAVAAGKVFVADTFNHRIRRIDNSQVRTLAGTGQKGFLDGSLSSAKFNQPQAVATADGVTLYVADSFNDRLRRIFGGVVTTIAGSGISGFTDGPALQAQLKGPHGLAIGGTVSRPRIYFTDEWSHRLRVLRQVGTVDTVETIAGGGPATPLGGSFADGELLDARFRRPAGLALDGNGWVYLADTDNHRLRQVAP